MIAIWTQAIRPRTLIASISPACIGSALAYTHKHFHLTIFLLTTLTALCIQIMINLSNDYFDFIHGADTEKRKGPQRVTQAGLVSHIAIKKAILLCCLCAAVAAIPLIYIGGWPICLLFLLYITLGLGYTTGPWPLAYLGLGDICVLTLFGPIATLISYYLQTHSFSLYALCAGCGSGLISSAILMVNNLRDEEEDRNAKKKTLVVRLGQKTGLIIYSLELLLALIIPCLYNLFFPLLLLPFALILIKQALLGKNHNALLQRTGAFLLIYTLIYVGNTLFYSHLPS